MLFMSVWPVAKKLVFKAGLEATNDVKGTFGRIFPHLRYGITYVKKKSGNWKVYSGIYIEKIRGQTD